MEYSTTQQKDFYRIWYVTVITGIMEDRRDLGYQLKCKHRIVQLSREEYEIVAHELDRHGCCTKLKNIKTHSELIATYDEPQESTRFHVVSPADEAESCIVKIVSVE